MQRSSFLALGVLPAACCLMVSLSTGCPNRSTGGASSSSSASGTISVNTVTASTGPITPGPFCSKPGSVQFSGGGKLVVPGGVGSDLVSFVHLPAGFCAHYFGTVGNTRQLRFAPGGELFVASPTTGTTGGGPNGKASIVVLPDDNNDGVADNPITFLGSLPSTQGLLFAPGLFYYQDGTKIMQMPYKSGDRQPSGAATQVVDIQQYTSSLHWPKALDMADDGSIYVGNGGDQGEACQTLHAFHGGIVKIDGSANGLEVAKGLRNPIAVRCAQGHNQCFALELAKDYSAPNGGREKMLPIRQGDDWGFPCCATKNMPYTDAPNFADCSTVTGESAGFLIGDTPFALAFIPASWPSAYQNHAVVGTHGAAGSWVGARVVTIALDPSTGIPIPASDASGADTGSMVDFASGWDDGMQQHGRPAAFDFSPDGRLFVGSDANGVIFWIAPLNF